MPAGWTSRPRDRRALGGWIVLALDSTRRQPSASTIRGAVSSPRSVQTFSPSRPVTVAVSNSVSA